MISYLDSIVVLLMVLVLLVVPLVALVLLVVILAHTHSSCMNKNTQVIGPQNPSQDGNKSIEEANAHR